MGLFLLTILGILSMLKINAEGDIHPAKIYGKDFAIVGDEVEFVCSTYGLEKENDILNIYLCKNRLGTQQQLQKDKSKTKFYINDVKKEDSGNYSCVYSKTEYKPSDVRGKGDTSVFLQVSAGFLPADIALKETSVTEGSDVEFTCTISGFWRADSSDVSYTYLYKDGTAVQIKVWNSRIREVIFTLSKVHVGDSGSYSCLVISSKSISRNMTKPQGNNAIDLQVHGKGGIQEVMVGLVILLLIVPMLLGLWYSRLHFKQAACKKCTESEVLDDFVEYAEVDECEGHRGDANQSEVLDDLVGYAEIDECIGHRGDANQSEVLDDLVGYAEIDECIECVTVKFYMTCMDMLKLKSAERVTLKV